MASWIPISIQKKVLRYALSRIQLLDTDALDLDRLDITLGKRSTIELNIVELRKEKLAALIALPPLISIERASAGQVRITVPADLHTSSIIVELGNVGVSLSLHERPRKKKYRDETLPDAQDVAASFLRDEPGEERELEAALSTPDLRQSVSSSQSDEDGYGTAIGLPTFLAAFLQGIVDRMQVKVQKAVLNLETKLDSTPLIIRLAVDTIDLPVAYQGNRSVEIAGISVRLVSSASIFASLSQILGKSGPKATSESIPSTAETQSSIASVDTEKDIDLGDTNFDTSAPINQSLRSEREEDLTASKYFSHEQAESIYMSAIHEPSPVQTPPKQSSLNEIEHELLFLATVNVSVTKEQPITVTASGSDISSRQDIPGSFSMYAESTASLRRSHLQESTVQEDCKSKSSVELKISSGRATFDLIMLKLVIQLGRRMQTILEGESKASESSSKLTLALDSITISIVDSMTTSNSLLKLSLTEMVLSLGQKKRVEFCLSAGFPDEDFLSFSKHGSLKASLLDLTGVNKDVVIELDSHIHIATQPVSFNLDIQRLDGVLGAFGGLSGFLELGSSVLSEEIPTKTVRFEPVESHSRLNIRIGGLYLSLHGQSCDLTCKTSSIKIVKRSEVLGLRIDKVQLHGPLTCRVNDVQINHLSAPVEGDLTKLISLLTPSKDKFEKDDDFLLDTLLRQRRKGAVLRVNVSHIKVDIDNHKSLSSLQELGSELSKLSVVKYLPEEQRPGTLTLAHVDNISTMVNTPIGLVTCDLGTVDVAHVGTPALIALTVAKVSVWREMGKLVNAVIQGSDPMIMARWIEDEIQPTVKVKLWNICVDYSVGLAEDLQKVFTAELPDLTKSVVELGRPEAMNWKIDIAFRDCALGLTPKLPSKALLFLSSASFLASQSESPDTVLHFDIRKADLLLVDNVKSTSGASRSSNPVIRELCAKGYVSVLNMSSAVTSISLVPARNGATDMIVVDFKNDFLLLETCADSTQTLISTLSALKPASPPSTGERYRTEIAPVADMMASFTGDDFSVPDTVDEQGYVEVEVQSSLEPESLPPQVQQIAKKWDSLNNRYIPVTKAELQSSPLQVHVHNVHIIWNLYDGYDWESTRTVITEAVHDVETLAETQQEAEVIGDFLFNSIYIGVNSQHPQELARQINQDIDMFSEISTSTATARPASATKTPKLKLERSKHFKIAFELRGVAADIFAYPPGETQTSIDLRVADFEILDHVPTSTWKKFATYMQDAGQREENRPMVHMEVCNVRPVPDLTATELVIRVSILPLRLHVDQDALDFITRFFEFKDDKEPSKTEEPYLQRVEVRPIPVKLDYKPKKVDYVGLRSGRTNEFMNFFILDGAEFVLRHVIIYGCSGMLRLHHSLEDVWMPDVKRNQLPSVLSGLNGVRSLVNVGTGVRDLVQIPINEYRKDGRIVRSISRGALAFAQTTGGELTRIGAKLAVGAHNALEGAEGLFVAREAEERAISQYANQPVGILQGLRGAARSLERDLLVARDAVIAVSGEVRDSADASGVARAVARHAPTLVLRPMIGATRALSQTLMGATNAVDPAHRRRMEDVSGCAVRLTAEIQALTDERALAQNMSSVWTEDATVTSYDTIMNDHLTDPANTTMSRHVDACVSTRSQTRLTQNHFDVQWW